MNLEVDEERNDKSPLLGLATGGSRKAAIADFRNFKIGTS